MAHVGQEFRFHRRRCFSRGLGRQGFLARDLQVLGLLLQRILGFDPGRYIAAGGHHDDLAVKISGQPSVYLNPNRLAVLAAHADQLLVGGPDRLFAKVPDCSGKHRIILNRH